MARATSWETFTIEGREYEQAIHFVCEDERASEQRYRNKLEMADETKDNEHVNSRMVHPTKKVPVRFCWRVGHVRVTMRWLTVVDANGGDARKRTWT